MKNTLIHIFRLLEHFSNDNSDKVNERFVCSVPVLFDYSNFFAFMLDFAMSEFLEHRLSDVLLAMFQK